MTEPLPEETRPLTTKFVFGLLKRDKEKNDERFKLLEETQELLRKRLDKAGKICKEVQDELRELKGGKPP